MGKLVTRARGPYTFIKYTGVLGVTAVISAADGSQQTVSVLNILPMHPATIQRLPSQDESSDVTDSEVEPPELLNPPPGSPAQVPTIEASLAQPASSKGAPNLTPATEELGRLP